MVSLQLFSAKLINKVMVIVQIKINGKVTEIEPLLSLAGFLETRGIKPGAVVVQYNGDIIDKGLWTEVLLKENDELEILRFVGGG